MGLELSNSVTALRYSLPAFVKMKRELSLRTTICEYLILCKLGPTLYYWATINTNPCVCICRLSFLCYFDGKPWNGAKIAGITPNYVHSNITVKGVQVAHPACACHSFPPLPLLSRVKWRLGSNHARLSLTWGMTCVHSETTLGINRNCLRLDIHVT